MDKELLNWLGNTLNFFIAIYLIVATVNGHCFNFSQSLITIFGIFVSILIQLRNIIREE
jgi:hypothetical protein